MKKFFTLFVVALMSVGMSFAEEINLTMDSEHGDFVYRDRLAQKNYWYFEASNGTYMVRLQSKNCTQFAGSYVLEDMESIFLNNLKTRESIKITAASFTTTQQEGTLKVEGTLEAQDGNTYIISLTYYDYAAGIEDVAVEVKAVKRIVDGQLIIERDGKLYNATGAEVK